MDLSTTLNRIGTFVEYHKNSYQTPPTKVFLGLDEFVLVFKNLDCFEVIWFEGVKLMVAVGTDHVEIKCTDVQSERAIKKLTPHGQIKRTHSKHDAYVEYMGVRHSLHEWGMLLEINEQLLWQRYYRQGIRDPEELFKRPRSSVRSKSRR